jgi:tRNA C32,U32 (ribose-2'-O)-methylase TrmJ
LLNVQRVTADSLDAEQHAVAVFGTERNGLQDQQVKRAR